MDNANLDFNNFSGRNCDVEESDILGGGYIRVQYKSEDGFKIKKVNPIIIF